jgi:hypothetical protein
MGWCQAKMAHFLVIFLDLVQHPRKIPVSWRFIRRIWGQKHVFSTYLTRYEEGFDIIPKGAKLSPDGLGYADYFDFFTIVPGLCASGSFSCASSRLAMF